MSSELMLQVQQVSKCYRIYQKPHHRLKQMILTRGRYFKEFWALRDISFNVSCGTTLGILGRNGAGKSSLLQIICGTLTPTQGAVHVQGRIGALLELGTGFNPDFTGEENVYLNATILGLSRAEIDERYEEIVAFADIGEFVYQPVKTYSSGMLVRLAFAVAININPELLVIDEALAVGDVKFQAKCFRKLEELRAANKIIILVTHSPEQIVRHCDQAMLLEQGKMLAFGDPKQVANQYLDLLFGVEARTGTQKPGKRVADIESSQISTPAQFVDLSHANSDELLKKFIQANTSHDLLHSQPGYNKSEYRWGNNQAQILDAFLCSAERCGVNHFSADEQISVYLKVKFYEACAQPIYGLTIKTPDGVVVYGTNSRDWNETEQFSAQAGGDVAVVGFYLVPALISGHYLLSLGVASQHGEEIIPLDRRYDVLEIYITNTRKSFGLADLRMQFKKVA